MQYRHRLRKIRTSKETKQFTLNNRFLKHFYMLIKTTSKEKSEQDVIAFIIISSLLFLFTFSMIVLKFQDIIFGLILGLLISSIPYMVLQIRLRKLRFLMGEEFLSIVQSLT